MIDEIKARLELKVPDLANRVEGAAEFTKLMADNRLPTASVAAYILPLGLQGGAATASTGFFEQSVTETFGIVIFIQSLDRTGRRALERLKPFLDSVIAAIAGWAPGDQVGVFQLARGTLINPGAGRLAYQLDFSINDQLRITP